ncbi:MAG: AAC(3) family N-acetyltransferase [Anaerolineales bacterium]|nr:AAC(3) family N-acetyltransferase [Anaerolineales bacterium]
MVSYRDLINMLRDLGLDTYSRVVVHASLTGFEHVTGGARSLVGALIETCETVIMPAFTTTTMVVPPFGPPDNGLDYGSATGENLAANIYTLDLPADEELGLMPEVLRQHERSSRSRHPILSFVGINAEEAIAAQTIQDPMGAIAWLAEYDGDVLLIGDGHRRNFSLHYAEKLSGRKQFTRWALTPGGVLECPNMPGCPDGFQSIASRLDGISRRDVLDGAPFELVPLRDLLHLTSGWLHEDPSALLCAREDCVRCGAVRRWIEAQKKGKTGTV